MCSDTVLFNNKAGYLERRLQVQIPEAGAFIELLFVLFVGLELLLIEILEAGAGAFTELLFVRLELLQSYFLLGWSFYLFKSLKLEIYSVTFCWDGAFNICQWTE